MENLEPKKTKESKQTLDQKTKELSDSDKKLINDNKSFFEKRNNTYDAFLTGKQLVDKHRKDLTKGYAFSVNVNGETFHAQKVRGQNKYIAFDKDGNRLNEGLKSSKQDFEELVKDGLKQKKRDDALDKKDVKNKAKEKNKPTPTIKTFEDLAKKTKSPEDFINKIREIKNVPPQVSEEFFNKYNPSGNLTPQQAASKMWYNANPKDIL